MKDLRNTGVTLKIATASPLPLIQYVAGEIFGGLSVLKSTLTGEKRPGISKLERGDWCSSNCEEYCVSCSGPMCMKNDCSNKEEEDQA